MGNKNTESHSWKRALRLLRAIAALPEDAPARQKRITEARAFFTQSTALRLQSLARLLIPNLSDKQLLCVLVPVERVAARERITDADMNLQADDACKPVAKTRFPLIVVVDNIRSAINTGGIFRTCEFFGAEAVWLCGYTATPEHAHVARGAMGTEHSLPWRTFNNIRDAIATLRNEGRHIYALETCADASDVSRGSYTFPAAMLLGNERFGLDPEVIALADTILAIEGHGTKNSLNVVSAFAIATHAMRRRFDTC